MNTALLYHKACECRSATASCGRVRGVQISPPVRKETDRRDVTIHWFYYPMPSCDKCGAPWELEKGH